MKARRDVDGLFKALSYDKANFSKNLKIKRESAKALGDLRDIRAIDPLITKLTSIMGAVDNDIAVYPLVKIGEPAVMPLINALNDDKKAFYAIDALG